MKVIVPLDKDLNSLSHGHVTLDSFARIFPASKYHKYKPSVSISVRAFDNISLAVSDEHSNRKGRLNLSIKQKMSSNHHHQDEERRQGLTSDDDHHDDGNWIHSDPMLENSPSCQSSSSSGSSPSSTSMTQVDSGCTIISDEVEQQQSSLNHHRRKSSTTTPTTKHKSLKIQIDSPIDSAVTTIQTKPPQPSTVELFTNTTTPQSKKMFYCKYLKYKGSYDTTVLLPERYIPDLKHTMEGELVKALGIGSFGIVVSLYLF